MLDRPATDSEHPAAAAAPVAMPPRRAWRPPRWLLELGLLVCVLFGVGAWRGRHLIATSSPAAPFELADLRPAPGADRVSLRSLAGKRVLLHFWATWCGVCRQEFGALNSVQSSLGADEILISIVDDGDDPEQLRRFVAEHGIRYPVLLGNGAVKRAYGISAFPTNYFIDAAGLVRGHSVGMSTRWGLQAQLWWAGRVGRWL